MTDMAEIILFFVAFCAAAWACLSLDGGGDDE